MFNKQPGTFRKYTIVSMFCFTQKTTTRKQFYLCKCNGFEYHDRMGGLVLGNLAVIFAINIFAASIFTI